MNGMTDRPGSAAGFAAHHSAFEYPIARPDTLSAYEYPIARPDILSRTVGCALPGPL
jgi:hypothetical protein